MTENPNDIGAGDRVRTGDIQLGKVDTPPSASAFLRERRGFEARGVLWCLALKRRVG